MERKLPFHIQHNTTPSAVRQVIRLGSDGIVSPENVSIALGVKPDSLKKRIAPFLRQMGVLDGWRLSELGQRLLGLSQTHPDLLAEAVHVHLYTLHWVQPEAYFSFAYATICDWLWERGVSPLDTRTVNELVGVVVTRAAEKFGVDAGAIAFSANSVRGALHWLKALQPPVVNAKEFCRRKVCDLLVLLWITDRLYQHPDSQREYGVRLALTEERLRQIAKVSLLELDGLEQVLALADRTYDYRRPNGFFGVGTEGGFGRWLVLTKPFPVGNL